MCRDNKVSSSNNAGATRPNAWEWECGMCTLINRPSNGMCEMCGFPRGARSGEVVAAPEGQRRTSPPSSSAQDARLSQSPGQQILASLKQKADLPDLRSRSSSGMDDHTE